MIFSFPQFRVSKRFRVSKQVTVILLLLLGLGSVAFSHLPSQAQVGKNILNYPSRYKECEKVSILFGHRDGRGKHVRIEHSISDLRDKGFLNKAGSACTNPDQGMILYKKKNYNGRSMHLNPGAAYPRLSDGLNNEVSSVRLYSVSEDGVWGDPID